MRALGALDPRLLADPSDPLVGAGGRVARSAGPPALEAAGVHVISPAKAGPEQRDLCLGRGVPIDEWERFHSERLAPILPSSVSFPPARVEKKTSTGREKGKVAVAALGSPSIGSALMGVTPRLDSNQHDRTP